MMKVVKAFLKEGYAVQAEARGHVVHVDEPVEVGGGDSAMKPSEMMLSALASCKMITCKMYAERKQWPLEGLEIELAIDEDAPLVIQKTMRFSGLLEEEQIERLKVISGRCPVARMLHPDYSFQWKD